MLHSKKEKLKTGHKPSVHTNVSRREFSGMLNYARFDAIQDSDDDEADTPQEVPSDSTAPLPPGVRESLAAMQLATDSGDEQAAEAAAAALEVHLAAAPPEFRAAFAAARATREAKTVEGGLTNGLKSASASLNALDQAHLQIGEALDDPRKLASLLEESGVTEAELKALEASDDPQLQLNKLAERMVERTLAHSTDKSRGTSIPTSGVVKEHHPHHCTPVIADFCICRKQAGRRQGGWRQGGRQGNSK